MTHEPTAYELSEAALRDADLFRGVPLTNPKVGTWGGVPGPLLLRSDPNRIPDPDAFEAVALAGVATPLPALCPVAEPSDRSYSPEEREAVLAWAGGVREWRAKSHAAELARSLLLVGEPGGGKSRAAVARAQVWSLASGVAASSRWGSGDMRIFFVRGCDLASAAVAEARGEPHGLGSGIREVSSLGHMRLLVIDDFDAANWSPASLTALFEILDTRLSTGAPTIITANGNAAGWVERVLARHPHEGEMAAKILRRIRDLCGAPVRFNPNAKEKGE